MTHNPSTQTEKTPAHKAPVSTQFYRLLQLVLVFGFIQSLIAHALNNWAQVLGFAMPAGAHPVMVPMIAVFGEPGRTGITICRWLPFEEGFTICGVLITCTVIAVATYIILGWICDDEWVQEEQSVEDCWEEVVWYNPFSWVKALVCTVVTILVWVLKQICKIRTIFVVGLWIVCVFGGIVILL